MTRLNVHHLNIIDSWTGQALVSDVNFNVNSGETLGIIGESGSGKSITCKAIVGLNDDRLKVQGQINFESVDMLKLHDKQLKQYRGKEIAMIMQQGSRAFDPSSPVGQQMMETMQAHTSLGRQQVIDILVERMLYMKLQNPKQVLSMYPHMLSGGMLQRLMIALALALQPKLIIADEPTTALDTITQYEVLEAFNDMKQQMGCAMIFISHDLTVVNHVADHVAVMRAGRLVEQGTREAVLYHPQHAYTSYLLATKKKISDHFQRVMRGECNA